MWDIVSYPLKHHSVNQMDDVEHDDLDEKVLSSMKKICYGVITFVLWSSTTFLAHLSSKTCLQAAISETPLNSGIAWAIILTTWQAITCVTFTDLHLFDTRDRRAQIVHYVKMICHVFANLATNFSVTSIYASSTFTIKLLEPIMSAIIQRVVFGRRLSCCGILSLPLVIGGAVMFCGTSIFSSVSIVGASVAFSSNVIVAMRNIAIKLEHDDNSALTATLRSRYVILTATVLIILNLGLLTYLALKGVFADYVLFVIATGTSSSVFFFVCTYISTNVVLTYMSVVSHAIGNIFKRLIVIVLLCLLEERSLTLMNVCGLGICSFGLFLYVWGKRSSQSSSNA